MCEVVNDEAWTRRNNYERSGERGEALARVCHAGASYKQSKSTNSRDTPADIFCLMTCGECDGENNFFLAKSTCLAHRSCAALQSKKGALNTFKASACMTGLLLYSLPQRS